MSQLRESRRKGDFKYYIDLSTPNETQMRSAVKGEDRRVSRDGWKLAIAITLMIAGFYGLVLLWGSMQ